MLTLN
jgi:transcription factor C subunit 7